MNTPAPKPQSLIAALAASIAPPYRNAMAAFNLSAPWGYMQDRGRECTITALTAAITEAVDNTAPMRMPTKEALRSYLGVDVHTGPASGTASITGFDELYNEVKEVLTLRTISAMTGYDKLFNESLEKSDLIDNQAEMIAVLEDQLGRSIEPSEKRSARVNDLLEQNDALEKKNEELVGLPQKYHWDDVVETDGDAMRRMSLPRSSPTADHSLADCIRVRDSLAMQLHESDSKRNGLEHTIGVLTNERDEFKRMWKQEVVVSSGYYAMAQELAKVNATHIDMVNSVSAILSEFEIECPTNSIPDMVRSACEATRQHPQTDADMDATALKNSRGMTGYAPVPERQYDSGVPRIDKVNEDVTQPSILDGMAIDNVIGGTLLLGSAFALCYLAVKYMGLFQ